MKIKKIIMFLCCSFAFFGCKVKSDEITNFVINYIETVSKEHAKYKTNITENLHKYFYNDEVDSK